MRIALTRQILNGENPARERQNGLEKATFCLKHLQAQRLCPGEHMGCSHLEAGGVYISEDLGILSDIIGMAAWVEQMPDMGQCRS